MANRCMRECRQDLPPCKYIAERSKRSEHSNTGGKPCVVLVITGETDIKTLRAPPCKFACLEILDSSESLFSAKIRGIYRVLVRLPMTGVENQTRIHSDAQITHPFRRTETTRSGEFNSTYGGNHPMTLVTSALLVIRGIRRCKSLSALTYTIPSLQLLV